MVLTPVSRMGPPPRSFAADAQGPPPRSFAADAHDCIMVRSLSTYRIQGCGALIRARWQAPLGPIRCPTTDQLRSTRSKIELDRKRLIQGLLGVHSRCGLHTRAATNS